MPNISAHMIVAKGVGRKIGIDSDDYYRGNLLPDIISKIDSHHKIQCGVYLVPDIDYFLGILDFNYDMHIGYLVHLLLDKHFLLDYLGNLYPNKNVFLDGLIYFDYDYLNYMLVKRFCVDVEYLCKILYDFDCNILEERLKYNVECLLQIKSGETVYLDFDSFSSFLLDVSDIISMELNEYASKSRKLRFCFRK